MAQQPVWSRGHSRVLTAMAGGEYSILIGANLNSTKRAIDKDRTKSIAFKVVEPVPVWIGEHEAVFAKAEYPYAGLLWLEFCATEEAKNLSIKEAMKAHIFSPLLLPISQAVEENYR